MKEGILYRSEGWWDNLTKKRLAISAALALALAVSACQQTSTTPTSGSTATPSPTPTSGIAKTIAEVAAIVGGTGNIFTDACSVWSVAVGYNKNVTALLPASIQSAAAFVIASGNAICALPSSTGAQDLAELNALWVQIEALTTIPVATPAPVATPTPSPTPSATSTPN